MEGKRMTRRFDRIGLHSWMNLTCPHCMVESQYHIGLPMPKIGNLQYDEFEIIDNGKGKGQLEIWYNGICPNCKETFAIADRFPIQDIHDFIGYDYLCKEHNYEVKGELR